MENITFQLVGGAQRDRMIFVLMILETSKCEYECYVNVMEG